MTELIILEDEPFRLQLFKAELAHVNFVITGDVNKFLEYVRIAEEEGSLKLLIMDHDLGCAAPGSRRLNFDPNGLCGLDAAKALNTTVPVVVWSANTGAAQEMVRTLQDRNIQAVYRPIWQNDIIAGIFRQIFPGE